LNTTEPVGLKAPETDAESVAAVPTVILLLPSVVIIDGVVFWTFRISLPHALEVGLLLESPPYVACQLNVPVALKNTLTAPVVEPVRAATLLAMGTPVQAGPEYTLKVTVPVGLNPPETVALSETELPTIVELVDSEVLTVGVAFPTVKDSEPQVLVAGLLFESPL